MTSHKPVLTRRDFVRGTVGATLGASLIGATPSIANAQNAHSSTVLLVREQAVQDAEQKVDPTVLKKMLDDIVIQLTGKTNAKDAWSCLIQPSDVVGLVTSPALNPTHPELIDLVKQSLKEIGVTDENIRDPQNRNLDTLKACTALISMPGLKAHWLTGIGTVMKNYILFSGNPKSYHDENNAKLGEIWLLPDVKGKTKLLLVDALRPLCDKGPQPDPRYMWNYNGLIAGTDPVAVEAVGLKIIEEKRKALRGEPWPLTPPPLCVESAEKVYKLGVSDLSKIELKKLGWQEEILV